MNKEGLIKEANELVNKKQSFEQELQKINVRLIEIQGAVKNIDEESKKEDKKEVKK